MANMSTSYVMETWQKVMLPSAVIQSTICLGCALFSIYMSLILLWRGGFASSRSIPHRFEILGRYPKSVSFGITLALCSFLMSSISWAHYYWGCFLSNNFTFGQLAFIWGWFTWSVGQFCSYFVFLLKLVDTFSGSKYAIPRTTIVCMVILIILYQSVWIIKFAEIIMFRSDMHILRPTQLSMVPLIVIIDFSITITMTYMYISRMFSMMRGQVDYVPDNHIQMTVLRRSLTERGANNRLFMNLSTKISVLCITSLISSLIFVFLDAILVYSDFNVYVLWLTQTWFQIDTIITSVCLTLFLQGTKWIYRVLCCCSISVGHRCLKWRLLSGGFQHSYDLQIENHIIDDISSCSSDHRLQMN